MRGKACTYKLFERGRYVGTYTSAKVEEITGLPRNRVNRYARNRIEYSGKFRIILAGMIACSMLAACGPDQRPDFEHMPQDRPRWVNPAGYGLPKEVGE